MGLLFNKKEKDGIGIEYRTRIIRSNKNIIEERYPNFKIV